jgi:hypothetical protein
MNNIREIEPDNDGGPRRNTLVVHHVANMGLVKVNRALFCVVLLLLAIIFIFGFSLVAPDRLLKQLVNNQIVAEKAKAGMNPVLSNEINELKSQMVGLVSGSIESKLRVLELSIKSDSVSDVDLGIIGDLRNNVSVLRRFSKIKQARLFTSEQETVKELREAEQLMHEMTQLKMLIYITLASCGLMFAAIGGVWLQQRYLLGYEKKLQSSSK